MGCAASHPVSDAREYAQYYRRVRYETDQAHYARAHAARREEQRQHVKDRLRDGRRDYDTHRTYQKHVRRTRNGSVYF